MTGLREEGDDRMVRAGDPARAPIVTRAMRALPGPGARPWEATGSIEVEALCVWAYRDQRVDRLGNAGLYAIEAEADGRVWYGRSTDGCAAIADIAHMGCRVQSSGVSIRDSVHAAADMVATALGGIDGGHLVAFHARHAGRPDGWALPDRRYRPVMWSVPGVEAQWEHTDSGHRYCPIISVGAVDDVGRCRLAYARWWDALDQLTWALSLRAMGFAVLRPTAPREPWAEAA